MLKVGLILGLANLFLAIPGISYGEARKNFGPMETRREVVFNIGTAVVNGESFRYTPMVSLIYLTRYPKIFGNHWEAAVGIGETYGGIAWQFDVWLLEYLRIGAGLGVIPFFDAMPGNPILVPLPELSIGCHFQSGKLTYSGGATGNLGYGARAIGGMGYAF